jgi:hypothetical protein
VCRHVVYMDRERQVGPKLQQTASCNVWMWLTGRMFEKSGCGGNGFHQVKSEV